MWRTHRHNAATGLDGGHQGVKSELSTFWFVNLVPLGFASQELCRLLCIRASVRTCPYTSYRELYIIIKVYILHHPWSRFTLTIKLCFYFVPPANGRWHIYWWRLVSVSGLKLRGNGRSNTNPLMQKDLLMTIASSAQRSYVMLGKGDTTISHSVFLDPRFYYTNKGRRAHARNGTLVRAKTSLSLWHNLRLRVACHLAHMNLKLGRNHTVCLRISKDQSKSSRWRWMRCVSFPTHTNPPNPILTLPILPFAFLLAARISRNAPTYHQRFHALEASDAFPKGVFQLFSPHLRVPSRILIFSLHIPFDFFLITAIWPGVGKGYQVGTVADCSRYPPANW